MGKIQIQVTGRIEFPDDDVTVDERLAQVRERVTGSVTADGGAFQNLFTDGYREPDPEPVAEPVSEVTPESG